MYSVFIDNFDHACQTSNWKWDDTFLKKREKKVKFTEVQKYAIHVPRAIDVRKEATRENRKEAKKLSGKKRSKNQTGKKPLKKWKPHCWRQSGSTDSQHHEET